MRFGAPLGRAVKLTTSVSLLALVAVIVIPQLDQSKDPAPLWVRIAIPTLVVAIFIVIALFSVQGFELNGRELCVQRPLWETRLSLDDLETAHVDSSAMKGAWRMGGNGGLLVFCGWFRSKQLGKFRAFVTDRTRCVVMEFKGRNLVVSPDDPHRFVEALGFTEGSNKNRR